mgnify:CR=1 FL=1
MKKRTPPLLLVLALLCSLLAVPASAADSTPFYCPQCGGQTCTERIDSPTCTQSGGFYRTCTSCGFETMMVGPSYNEYHKSALGHDYQNGVCSRCGETDPNAEPDQPETHVHDWEITVQKQTCEQDGLTVRKCKECGEEEILAHTSAKGHYYVFTRLDRDEQGAYRLYTCNICHQTHKEYYAAPNTPSEPDGGTCTTHTWKTTTVPATCAQAGTKTKTCTRCGTEESEVIPKLTSHKWGSSTFTPTTCTTDGYTSRTCTVCGQEEILRTYPTSGHQYIEQVIRPATADQTGLKKLTCTRCGDTRQETIEKLSQSPAATQTGNRDSGSTSMKKLSQGEITQLLADNPLTLPANVFDSTPSCTAPFAAGTVKTEVLKAALNRLNLMRRLAGLPSVTLDSSMCEDAQYSAVIQGYYGTWDHYPKQPDGMSNSFYEKAYAASSKSNLAAGLSLTGSVDFWMKDSNDYNVDRLGHRRWQLNPTLGKVGFGYAEANTRYRFYATEKVFDMSGSGCDYDFIAWPASGNFPSELFSGDTAWSVSLNPNQYQITRQAEMIQDVTVTLTRQADGKVWTFHGDNYTATDSDIYFNVDTSNRGIPNCIIFRPDGIQKYEGTYTVRIDGLTAANGQSVKDFTYEVNFFGGNATTTVQPTQPTLPTQPTQPTTPTQPGQPQGTGDTNFRDVPEAAYYRDAVQWAVKENITGGTSATTFSPSAACTRGQMVTFLWRAAGSPAPEHTTVPFRDVRSTDYFYNAVLWAVENGITTGTGANTFSPNATVTRAQTVTFLHRAAGSPAAGSSNFYDVASDAYFADAVAWAAQNGITGGTGSGTFSPSANCTRAQIVTMLYRANS